MFSLKSVGAVAFLLTYVAAQANHTVNIPLLDAGVKASWCSGQIDTCGTLCNGAENNNICDPPTLVYNCTCSNGSAPGLQYYIPSMPNFLCNELFAVCDREEVSRAGKDKCLADQKANCGTIPIADYQQAPATTSSASASGSSTAASTGASNTGASAATTTSTSRGFAPTMVAGLGAGAFAMGVAAFGIML